MEQYCYDYPRPAVTVDAVLLYYTFTDNKCSEVLLIKRRDNPFKDMWALPGGFVNKDEDLLNAIHRELSEEVGIGNLILKQVGAYGTPGRDPRGHVVSVAFACWLAFKVEPIPGDDAIEAEWWKVDNLPELAFDHKKILDDAITLMSSS